MPLFKSLSNITQLKDSSSSLSLSNNPAFPPTAIQLYSTKYIHFVSNTIQTYNNNNIQNKVNNHNETLKTAAESKPKEYELLTYQPIYVPDHDVPSTSSSSSSSAAGAATATSLLLEVPNLGIWDCRCCNSNNNINNNTLSTSLLKSALYQYNNNCNNNNNIKPTFIITIDLDSNNFESLHSTFISMMLSILQSMYQEEEQQQKQQQEQQQEQQQQQQNEQSNNHESNTHTHASSIPPSFTTLLQFGNSPSSSTLRIQKDDKQLLSQMNIIIGAILPQSSSSSSSSPQYNNENYTMTYKEKQGLNLILYHLLKYSSDLNCTLCFLKQHDDDNNNNYDDVDSSKNDVGMNNSTSLGGIVPTGINVNEFAHVLKGILTNDEELLLKYKKNCNNDIENTITQDTQQQEDVQQQQHQHHNQQSVYLPNEYDSDLINSVYLRSASCTGVWDANIDNLWDALSPSTSTSTSSTKLSPINEENDNKSKDRNTTTTATYNNYDDEEEWLSKLAESVSAYTNSSLFGISNHSIDGSNSNKSVSASVGVSSVDDISSRVIKDSSNNSSSGGTVATKSSKRGVRKKPASGTTSKKNDGKDNVSDFFNDLLKS